jgi:hypothetical protein
VIFYGSNYLDVHLIMYVEVEEDRGRNGSRDRDIDRNIK